MIKKHTFDSLLKNISEDFNHPGMKSSDIIEIVLKHDSEIEPLLRRHLSEFKFKFIFNQFRKNLDASLGDQFENICNRHFYSIFQFLGYVNHDGRIQDAIFSKILYVHRYPHTQSAADLKNIAAKIIKNIPPASLTEEIL
jgi:MinD-like ATPase involved in chromosome partitioning or flagellar assembly